MSKSIFGTGKSVILSSEGVSYSYLDGYNIWSFTSVSQKEFSFDVTISQIHDSKLIVSYLDTFDFDYLFDIIPSSAFQETLANILHYTNIKEHRVNILILLKESLKWLGST